MSGAPLMGFRPTGAPPAAAPIPKIELPNDDSDSEQPGTQLAERFYDMNGRAFDQIGEGTYGQVFSAGCKAAPGTTVALKKIRMDQETREGFPITAIREIRLLSTLDHRNVIKLRQIVRSRMDRSTGGKGAIYMAFDYAAFDLTGYLEKMAYKLKREHVKCIMQQLLQGLHYCHSRGVLHRDLKLSNLLLTSEGVLKLADFGLARSFSKDQDSSFTNRVITLWYRPPELLLGATRYGAAVDMWSVGCIFFELLAGKALFPGKAEPEQMVRIFDVMGAPTEANWPGVSKLENYGMTEKMRQTRKECTLRQLCHQNNIREPMAIDLMMQLLQLDPAKRIDAYHAAQHDYFWHDLPAPSREEELTAGLTSAHEFSVKKKRVERNAAAAQQQPPKRHHPAAPGYAQGAGPHGPSQHPGHPSHGGNPMQAPGGHPQHYVQSYVQQPAPRGPPPPTMYPGSFGGGGAGPAAATTSVYGHGAAPPMPGGRQGGYGQPPPTYGGGYGPAAGGPPGPGGYGGPQQHPQAGYPHHPQHFGHPAQHGYGAPTPNGPPPGYGGAPMPGAGHYPQGGGAPDGRHTGGQQQYRR